MKTSFKVAAFVLNIFLAGCGSGGSGQQQPPPPPPDASITSVSVSPATVTVSTGGTRQFVATVQGTGSFSPGVSWSVTGNGSIDSNGNYTAASTAGTAFVTATSTQDTTKSGEATLTITTASVLLPGWYGKLVPSDNSTPMPLDFDLTQTGTKLQSGPVVIIADATTNPWPGCYNLVLDQPELKVSATNPPLQPQPNIPFPQMSGSITGQSVTLTYTPYWFGTRPTITLNGTMSTDQSGFGVITGTWSMQTVSACFSGAISGTFTLNQYSSVGGNYSGNFLTQSNNYVVPVSLASNSSPRPGLSYGAITPGPVCTASPVYSMQFPTTAGRYFSYYTGYAGAQQGSTNLLLWGEVSSQDGSTLNAFINSGGVGLSSCFNPGTTPLNTTLTRQ